MNKILLILLICLLACNENKDKDIMGIYKIDKTVFLSKQVNIKDYQYLELNSKGTFNVFHNKKETENQLHSKWKFLSELKDNGLLVQFEFEEKIIEGILRGNIFYFIYPNDFHNGKYQSVLYVRTFE